MKALRVVLMTLLTSALLCVTAYGAGYALLRGDRSDSTVDRAAAAPDEVSPSPIADDQEPPVPGDTIEPEPFSIAPGDRGKVVRELQSRLHQLAWFPELTTGVYDPATRRAVSGFQGKRGLDRTGTVDASTWRRLKAMTDQPTHDQMFNILHPGPTLLGAGDRGAEVRDLQARLVSLAWLFGDVTGTYDAQTVAAVEGFQAKRQIPVTGAVDQRTMDRLHAMTSQPTYEQMHNVTPEPGALDPRCETGRALCVDKSTNSLSWVVDGKVQTTFDVRFGSDELPTREGAFSVLSKSPDHVSSLYDTPMPFAMFFSGGQAVHYSPDFAANGYSGASHGCVNVRDYSGMAALFDQVRVGDKVIVYWS